jgi:hypothetical protein
MQARARGRGQDFVSFVRDALEAHAAGETVEVVSLPDVLELAVPKPKGAPRREPCAHRLSPAQFCRVCDA